MKNIFNQRSSYEYLLDPEEENELIDYISRTKEERQERYAEYLDSEEWQKLRSDCLKRDKNQCATCGKTYSLQVHHLSYKLDKSKTTLNDLITLCSNCHEKEHELK